MVTKLTLALFTTADATRIQNPGSDALIRSLVSLAELMARPVSTPHCGAAQRHHQLPKVEVSAVPQVVSTVVHVTLRCRMHANHHGAFC